MTDWLFDSFTDRGTRWRRDPVIAIPGSARVVRDNNAPGEGSHPRDRLIDLGLQVLPDNRTEMYLMDYIEIIGSGQQASIVLLASSWGNEFATNTGDVTDAVQWVPWTFTVNPAAKLYVNAGVDVVATTGNVDLWDYTNGRSMLASVITVGNFSGLPSHVPPPTPSGYIVQNRTLVFPFVKGNNYALRGIALGGDGKLRIQSAWLA